MGGHRALTGGLQVTGGGRGEYRELTGGLQVRGGVEEGHGALIGGLQVREKMGKSIGLCPRASLPGYWLAPSCEGETVLPARAPVICFCGLPPEPFPDSSTHTNDRLLLSKLSVVHELEDC